MNKPSLRIAVLGHGAIGRRVLAKLRELSPTAELGVLSQSEKDLTDLASNTFATTNPDELMAWKPMLVIECAGQAAVADLGPKLLASGSDFMVVSVGALADSVLLTAMKAATKIGGRLYTVSGAIGGLDALAAANAAGLDEVTYVGRKPPLAWRGTPAEREFDLDRLDKPTLIFQGTAANASQLYPKNANVTAAVALAGIGFERTMVRIFADPTIDKNVHELCARGSFGSLHLRLENEPLPDNPKTSWLAALSIEAALRSYLNV